VTVAALARELRDGGPPPGLAAISFDDGMRNNYTSALPILQGLGVTATVYVATDFIGGRSPWIGSGGDGEMLAESELGELVAAGWEIGAHTLSHADLSVLDYDSCRAEIEQGRDELQRITGVEVETLAYPFGRYGPAALRTPACAPP
jgi:peptidoglycan/xylan/chitin deacetylase (PgdA/CDA1 family)